MTEFFRARAEPLWGFGRVFCLPTPPKPKFLQKNKIPKYTVRGIVFLRRGETVPLAIRRAFPLGQRTNGGMDRSNKTSRFMPFVFLRTYRLPPCAKARGNGFFQTERGVSAVAKGFDVLILEKDYIFASRNEWNEEAEIEEQKKEYCSWFSPNAAKARSNSLYREDVLRELRDGHWKKPVFFGSGLGF